MSGADSSDASVAGETQYGARIALVVVIVGALALVAEAGEWILGAVAVAGVATALGLRQVSDEHVPTAAVARAIASLGVLGGIVATAATVSYVTTSPLTALVLSVGVWVAIVATVAVLAEMGGREPLRTVGWTMAVLGAVVGAAALAGVGAVIAGTSPPAGVLLGWAFASWLVTGGSPAAAIPILLTFAGLLCGAIAAALTLVPWHVVLSPRAEETAIHRLESTTDVLAKLAVGLFGCALLVYLLPIAVPFSGPAAVLERAIRTLLLVATLGVLGATLVVFLGRRLSDGDRRSIQSTVASAVGGLLAAAVVVGVVSPLVPAGTVRPDVALAITAIVAVAVLPVLAALVTIGSAIEPLENRPHAVPVAALTIAAVAGAQFGAALAPILAVGAALICWDALAYRARLRSELLAVDALDLERRHVGATVGVVAVGVLTAIVVERLAAFLGPHLGGEPLVVVVVAVALLAAVTVAAGRRPA